MLSYTLLHKYLGHLLKQYNTSLYKCSGVEL